ncbi:MAG: hypothetical protein AAF692_02155, partial [Pseudomonadota bacterium]
MIRFAQAHRRQILGSTAAAFAGFVASGASARNVDGWIAPDDAPATATKPAPAIRSHWPDPDNPPKLFIRTTDQAAHPEPEDATPRDWSAVLIFATLDQLADPRLAVLFDRIAAEHTPAVLVTDRPERISASFRSDGVVVVKAGHAPASLASMLYALIERQPGVAALASHLRLTQSFQGEAAQSLDRVHDELLQAARVQREFLPKPTLALPGLASAVLYQPHGFVSGDIYDTVELDDGR